jgi:hypothetical protein
MKAAIIDAFSGLKPQQLRVILFLWVLSLAECIISFSVIAFKIRPKLSGTLALHYNVVVGVDLFGKGYYLYQIPLIGLLFILINFFLYYRLGRRGSFLAFLLSFITAAANLCLLAAALFLLRVN